MNTYSWPFFVVFRLVILRRLFQRRMFQRGMWCRHVKNVGRILCVIVLCLSASRVVSGQAALGDSVISSSVNRSHALNKVLHNVQRPRVLVSVPPLGFLMQELYGTAVETAYAIAQDTDYHAPLITPEKMHRWLEVDWLIWMGAENEPQLSALVKRLQIARPEMRVTDLSELNPAEQHDREDHLDVSTLHHELEHSHPWLIPTEVRDWVQPIMRTGGLFFPEKSAGHWGHIQQRFSEALNDVEQAWKMRFQAINNRSFLQTHAAFDGLATYFALEPVGALTTHHDVAVGFKGLMILQEQVKRHQTRCVVRLPGENTGIPETLISSSTRVREIDPLGRALWKVDSMNGYTVFLNTILSDIFQCLTGGSPLSLKNEGTDGDGSRIGVLK